MTKIFISYRRADSRKDAGRIYDRFVEVFGKENVFKDVDNISSGADFRGALIEAASSCDVLLAIIGQQWLTIKDERGNRRLDNPDDYVRTEIEIVLKRDGARVIPVLVDGVSMPAESDLPHSLGQLAYKNAATVRDDPDFHHDVSRLLDHLRAHCVPAERHPMPPQPINTVSAFDIHAAINNFFYARDERDWESARALLDQIRSSGKAPSVFNVDQQEKAIGDAIEEQCRDHEYNILWLMVQRDNPARVLEALNLFWMRYPGYDPDGLEDMIKAKVPTSKASPAAVSKNQYRDDEYNILWLMVQRDNPARVLEALNLFWMRYPGYDPDGLEDMIKAKVPTSKAPARLVPDQTRAIAKLMSQLEREEKAQKWDRVIDLGERVLALDDSHESAIAKTAKAYYKRGKNHWSHKDCTRAIADYTRAIELDPTNADYFHDRGVSYYKNQDDVRAIADYTRAIELDRNRASFYWDRGKSHWWNKEYAQAITDHTRAIELDPTNADYYRERGVSYHSNKDYARATADYTRAIELNPNQSDYFFKRGVSYHSNKDYARAIADYTRAIELNPNQSDYFFARSRSYSWITDKQNEYRADLERAAALGDEDAQEELDTLK